VLDAGLRGAAIAEVVKRSVERVGLDAARYSGHSLRSGLATSAAAAGKTDRAIMQQGRWRGREMVDRYVRDARLLDEHNASKGIGL
jgi:integrase